MRALSSRDIEMSAQQSVTNKLCLHLHDPAQEESRFDDTAINQKRITGRILSKFANLPQRTPRRRRRAAAVQPKYEAVTSILKAHSYRRISSV